MKVVLAADHRGFALKEELKRRLEEEGFEVEDVGAFEYDQGDDYPDFALKGARRIAQNPEYRGVFLCSSGMGMDVVANKMRGVRATLVYSRDSAVHARAHDDINVMTLAADSTTLEEAYERVEAFLSTPFSGEERHLRRLEKIARLETEQMK